MRSAIKDSQIWAGLPVVLAAITIYQLNQKTVAGAELLAKSAWVASLGLLALLAAFFSRGEARAFFLPVSVLVLSQWVGGHAGAVLTVVGEAWACGLSVFMVHREGEALRKSIRQASLLGVSGAFAMLCLYALDERFTEPGIFFSIYLLLRMSAFTALDISSKLGPQGGGEKRLSDMFFSTLVPTNLFLLFYQGDLSASLYALPLLVVLAALSFASDSAVLLSLFALTIHDWFLAPLVSVLILFQYSFRWGGYLSAIVVASVFLVTQKTMGSGPNEITLAMASVCAFFVGRSLVLSKNTMGSGYQDLLASAAAMGVLGYFVYHNQNDLSLRVAAFDYQTIVVVVAAILGSGFFFAIRNRAGFLTAALEVKSIWDPVLEFARGRARNTKEVHAVDEPPTGNFETPAEVRIHSDGFVLARWMVLIIVALWGALWLKA